MNVAVYAPPSKDGGHWEQAEAGAFVEPSAPLTVLLVGGGPTGVEIAGAISELMAYNVARDFRLLDTSQAKVLLVEQGDFLLNGFSRGLQQNALRTLESKGVEVRLRTAAAEVSEHGARFTDGSFVPASTVVCTAGVAANPLPAQLPGRKGVEVRSRSNRTFRCRATRRSS